MKTLKNRLTNKLLKFFAVAACLFALGACADNDAEEAGEKIDEVVTDAGNAIEDACENVKEGADAKDEDC